jgi:short-subunit dehydrogenase
MATDTARPRALVTGASAGIGEGFAKQLARRGYDLVLVARRRGRLDALAEELGKEHGATCEVIAADLTQDESVARVEERLRAGDIELLVNNAGFGTFGQFAKLPIERELAEVDLNVRALFRLTHAALGPMIERRRGGIINVASGAAFQPIPYNTTYAATKAFVLHLSEGLHEEVKSYGVTVTCLCPGPVKTEFQEVAGISDREVPFFSFMPWEPVDAVVEAALSGLRAGRAIVSPGIVNMMTTASSRITPRFLVRRMAAAVFRSQGLGGGS